MILQKHTCVQTNDWYSLELIILDKMHETIELQRHDEYWIEL